MKEKNSYSGYKAAMNEASNIKMKPFNMSRNYPAYIVLVIALILSILVYFLVDRSVVNSKRNQFDKATSSVVSRLEQGYQINLQVLNSVRGLYDNMIQVVRDYFMLYTVVPLKSYPSITSMMSVQRIKSENLIYFRHYVQSQGYLEYDIFPQTKQKEFYPVEFIFPDTTCRHLHGLDISTVKELMDEIESAKVKKGLISTSAFILRKPDTLSIFLISPVFKMFKPEFQNDIPQDSLDKLVILEMSPQKYIKSSLGNGVTSDTTIVFECFQKSGNQKIDIYKSENYNLLATAYTPFLTETKLIKIGDKDLNVKISTIPNFGGNFNNYLPLISFIISLIVSGTLFGFILSVTTTKAKAVELAERLTRSQRRIMENTSDIIASMSFDGNWITMNHAAIKIFGIDPNDMIGRNISEICVNEKDVNTLLNLKNHAQDEVIHRFDFFMTQTGGLKVWVSWNFSVSMKDGLIYCVGRDVTLEKLAEAENNIKIKQIRLAEQLKSEASEFKSLFLTNLSFRFRNSLTTIMGYQQLIMNDSYDDKDELDSYMNLTYESTQELLTNITDMVDVAAGSDQIHLQIERIDVTEVVNLAIQSILSENPDKKFNINFNDPPEGSILYADKDGMIKTLKQVFTVLSLNIELCDVTIGVTPNPYERDTEVVLQTGPNPFISEMIDMFKESSTDLISAIRFDKEDVLLNLGLSSSMIRTMGGTMNVETFGREDGNVIIMTLPFLTDAED